MVLPGIQWKNASLDNLQNKVLVNESNLSQVRIYNHAPTSQTPKYMA